MEIETQITPISTICRYFRVDADQVRKHYKRNWSNYRTWESRDHATEYLVYPQNMAESIAIDEVTLSKGELYTYITAKGRGQRKGTLIASIRGTKASDIIDYGKQIPESERLKVKEVSLDMAPNMKNAVQALFPNARLVTDRFHVVKLVIDALQQVRINYRWEAIKKEQEDIDKCRKQGKAYKPEQFKNEDTRKELLARSRFLLFKLPSTWTDHQKERSKILFKEYPKLRDAYKMVLKFRQIYSQQSLKKAKEKILEWLEDAQKLNLDEFNSVIHSIGYHLDTILNFFINRSTNAAAESFNAKIKGFRANMRGVSNPIFFLFRMEKLFA